MCFLFTILGHPTKASLEYQRISIDRTKLSEDEAFEHAIDMISSRQMGFRKAADFFQVKTTYAVDW
jgi:helix-turn-helix, Psq domain